MNARLAVEKLVELKASFLNQAKANAERHNRDLFVEIERLRKSFFKMYGLSEETIEQLVSEVVNELKASEIIEVWDNLNPIKQRAFGGRFATNNNDLKAWNKPFAELSELKKKRVLYSISNEMIHTLNSVIS